MENLKKVYWFNEPKTINDNFDKVEKAVEALEQGVLSPANAITTFSGVGNIPSVPGTIADGAATQTYLASAIPVAEQRLDNLESKVNAIINALRTTGVILT